MAIALDDGTQVSRAFREPGSPSRDAPCSAEAAPSPQTTSLEGKAHVESRWARWFSDGPSVAGPFRHSKA